MNKIALSCLDKEIIQELHHLPKETRIKLLWIMIEKRELEKNLVVFSEAFTSKLTWYETKLLKKWTKINVSLNRFASELRCPQQEIEINDLVDALRYVNFEKYSQSSGLDVNIIKELFMLPEPIQRKVLSIMIQKRKLDKSLAVFSRKFISELTWYEKWFFKKHTRINVSLDMFKTRDLYSSKFKFDNLINEFRELVPDQLLML
jgi:hypothetical protein